MISVCLQDVDSPTWKPKKVAVLDLAAASGRVDTWKARRAGALYSPTWHWQRNWSIIVVPAVRGWTCSSGGGKAVADQCCPGLRGGW